MKIDDPACMGAADECVIAASALSSAPLLAKAAHRLYRGQFRCRATWNGAPVRHPTGPCQARRFSACRCATMRDWTPAALIWPKGWNMAEGWPEP